MSSADDAYAEAVRLIAEAKLLGAVHLSFHMPSTLALVVLPPEIAALDKLQSLDLYGLQIADLSPLSEMTGVTNLRLQWNQVRDLRPISGMVALKFLALHGVQVTDLTPIAALVRLTNLYLDDTQITDLSPLAGLGQISELSANNTQIFDLTPLAGMLDLKFLSLDNTQITNLMPLVGIVGMEVLSLNDTKITDLSPIAGMTGMMRLELSGSQVMDMRPLSKLLRLTKQSLGTRLTFENSAASKADARIAEISVMKDAGARAKALFAYLQDWVPPGEVGDRADFEAIVIPTRIPAPLETEIRNDILAVAVPLAPPLPPGPVNDRARKGWEALREFREDFAQSVNIANYRPLASAVAAFDRAMAASYDEMNEIGVGQSGLRIEALARDAEFTATLPEGAGTELGTLAAAITTFSSRFPEWMAYLSDPEEAMLVADAVQAEIDAFAAIESVLAASPDVAKEVLEEYRDEVELVRLSPQSEFLARGLLSSTRDLLRTLSEDALLGLRLYRDQAKEAIVGGAVWTRDRAAHEAQEFAKIAPTEMRKKSMWLALGITYDILIQKGGIMVSLAAQFPAQLGWLARVLKLFGIS